MNYRMRIVRTVFPVLSLVLLFSCHDRTQKEGKDEGKTAATIVVHGGVDLKSMLEYAAENGDKLNDSTILFYRKLVNGVYDSNGYTAIWSRRQQWLPRRIACLLSSAIAKSTVYFLPTIIIPPSLL